MRSFVHQNIFYTSLGYIAEQKSPWYRQRLRNNLKSCLWRIAHYKCVEIGKYKLLFNGFTYDVLYEAFDPSDVLKNMFIGLTNFAFDEYRW